MHFVRIGFCYVCYGEVSCFLNGCDPFGRNVYGGIGRFVISFLNFLGAHLREEENFLYGGLSGHEHDEPVHTYSHTRCGRHAVFESPDKVIVDEHGFVVSFFGEAELFFETQPLVDGVVELGVGISEFFTVYH